MKKYHYWVTAALSLVGLAVTAAGSLQLANRHRMLNQHS